ncbi:arginase family protein [Actinopolymorpha alba]|uniref:arginase family protein n=1 Tax=Actinopolymorpha alba TaxID=533267 RepID=UPI000367CEB2|nr:arginase family protein [Actinopolymorpha alba]
MTSISVLDAPSNLGLRMPSPGVVPGCYKLAGALRDLRFLDRIGAADAGYVVPPRYDVSDWKRGDGVMNARGMAAYSTRLADRIGDLVDAGEFVVLLGGDCSIMLGPTLALRRRGRYGLVYLDASSDFRQVGGNVSYVGAAAGEVLALVTGRGQDDIVNLEGLRPYVRDSDILVMGIRDFDEYRDELAELDIPTWTAAEIIKEGPTVVAERGLRHLAELEGFWVHVDADVLDPSVMPAVDAPDPDGLDHPHLVELLRPLLAHPGCVGVEVTIFDPDLDPDGRLAEAFTDTVVSALSGRVHATS